MLNRPTYVILHTLILDVELIINNNNNFICTNIIYNTKIKTMQIKNKEHQGTKTTYGIL